MKGDIIGIKTTLRKAKMESFLEKLLFIVHVGEGSNVLPLGKPYFHPEGIIQWGSPIYFHKIKYDNKEKFGWNISISITVKDKKPNSTLEQKYCCSHMLILFRD